jgi:hypothetical protein
LETKRRLEKILTEFATKMQQHERAVEVLEMIGTPNARAVLQDLGKGDPSARLTQDAIDAIRRLNQRR